MINSTPDNENVEMFKCLTIKQPFADCLIKSAYMDVDGTIYAEKSIEVRSMNTKHRGDVLICASHKGLIPHNTRDGIVVGLVELFHVKPISEFTEKDWMATRVKRQDWGKIKKGYGWCFRNPRPVVELPVKGKLGFWWLAAPKDTIIEYPKSVVLDEKAYRKIMRDNYDKLAFDLPIYKR